MLPYCLVPGRATARTGRDARQHGLVRTLACTTRTVCHLPSATSNVEVVRILISAPTPRPPNPRATTARATSAPALWSTAPRRQLAAGARWRPAASRRARAAGSPPPPPPTAACFCTAAWTETTSAWGTCLCWTCTRPRRCGTEDGGGSDCGWGCGCIGRGLVGVREELGVRRNVRSGGGAGAWVMVGPFWAEPPERSDPGGAKPPRIAPVRARGHLTATGTRTTPHPTPAPWSCSPLYYSCPQRLLMITSRGTASHGSQSPATEHPDKVCHIR